MRFSRSLAGVVLLQLAACATDALPAGGDAAPTDGAGARDAAVPLDAVAVADLALTDLGVRDAPLPFLGPLEGIWLIGWSGHLNHYSWVRFTVAGQTQGRADYLDGKDLPFNGPLWPCNGPGQWSITQKADTVQLVFPPACNFPDAVFTFSNYGPPGNYPKGAILQAKVDAAMGGSFGGYKFAPAQCNANMTTCANPL